jgi:methylated-DNA-protein-cysteine methyltransferase-like protein
MKTDSFFSQVYALVKKIPPGKVTTYGHIAQALGTRDARRVGWALHANKSPEVPCHRVVNKEGKLAKNFAFNGWQEQKRRLLEEGIEFSDEAKVNLQKHLFLI